MKDIEGLENFKEIILIQRMRKLKSFLLEQVNIG